MQLRHAGFRLSGLYTLASLGQTWEAVMGATAEKKHEALEFWNKHGLSATLDAFRVSRATLYAWRAKHRAGGLPALRDRSRAPRRPRRRNWPPGLLEELRALRRARPGLGTVKLRVLLEPVCFAHRWPCPSPRTLVRMLADDPNPVEKERARQRRATRRRRSDRVRKPKDFRASAPGECVALDTIVRRGPGRFGYILTAIDLHTRVALALAPPRASSAAAGRFLGLLTEVFPAPIQRVLTDNGAEFQGRFAEALARAGIAHWHTYPNCPKMNAHVERFNRTLQEDFVEGDEDLMWTDLPRFNRRLWDYLGWYNRERPHHSLGLRAPLVAMNDARPTESSMCWRKTVSFWRLATSDTIITQFRVRP